MTELDRLILDVARRHRDQVEALLATLPVGATLCVHEPRFDDGFAVDRDATTFSVRSEAHVLPGGVTCDSPARREQCGPMTAEIQAQVAGLPPSPAVLEGVAFRPVVGGWCDRCGDINYDAATRACLTCMYPDDPCSRAYLEGSRREEVEQ